MGRVPIGPLHYFFFGGRRWEPVWLALPAVCRRKYRSSDRMAASSKALFLRRAFNPRRMAVRGAFELTVNL